MFFLPPVTQSRLKTKVMLNQKVAVIFDRKKVAEKRGSGKVELRIYISRKERKYISFGDVAANE